MYAKSTGSRPAGAAAALLINGALLAGLMFAAPQVIGPKPTKPITIIDIKSPPPPPPEPVPTPETKAEVRETLPFAPKPPIDLRLDPFPLETTTQISDKPLVLDIGKPEGTAEVKEPVAPPPPLIAAEIDPRYADALQPDYPSSEIRLGREGRVSVRVQIGTDGRVMRVEKVSATSDAFFEAARKQAERRWRFRPATRGGKPEVSWKTMNLRFELNNR